MGLQRDRQVITNNVQQRLNEIATAQQQVQLGTEMVDNYTRLLAGETQLFNVGESSLFLVNGREVPLIESRIKQVALEAKLQKSYFALDHAMGILWQQE